MVSEIINDDNFEGYVCGQYIIDNSGCYVMIIFFSLIIFYLDFKAAYRDVNNIMRKII